MPPLAKTLSEGDHPILLWAIDDSRQQPEARSEAGESQGSIEPNDAYASSASGGDQTPDSSPVRIRSSSDLQRLEPNACLANRRQELEHSRAVKLARRSLRSDLESNSSNPREEGHIQDEDAQPGMISSESGSEYSSSSSRWSTEADFNHRDHQVGLAGAGEHFPSCEDTPNFLDINDESGLEDSVRINSCVFIDHF